MDKSIRIAQYMDQRMVSPVEENFMTIDGATYATGKDGQGLYRLIPEGQARFFNEAVPINGKFRLKKCLTDEKKKEAVIKELQRLKDKEVITASEKYRKEQQHWIIGVSGTVALSMNIFLSFQMLLTANKYIEV